jgi:hypothetical protein
MSVEWAAMISLSHRRRGRSVLAASASCARRGGRDRQFSGPELRGNICRIRGSTILAGKAVCSTTQGVIRGASESPRE